MISDSVPTYQPTNLRTLEQHRPDRTLHYVGELITADEPFYGLACFALRDIDKETELTFDCNDGISGKEDINMTGLNMVKAFDASFSRSSRLE